MSFKTALWHVRGGELLHANRVQLDSEKQLEDWLVKDPALLGTDLLVIGRQVRTIGGPLDILAINADGDIVIIELKRDRTPREVVAQVLDYASWISKLEYDHLDRICAEFLNKSLQEAFQNHFKFTIPDATGTTHSMLIVASELDDQSERIVAYLQQDHNININAVYFSVFEIDGRTLLARSWLADPDETTERIEARKKRPWSGLWFVNDGVDEGRGRSWELCRKYHFISAGGGTRWSGPLNHLQVGAELVAFQKGHGYLGYGIVTATAVPASQFRVDDGRSLSDVAREIDPNKDDPSRCEYAVGVDWRRTVPVEQAKWFVGAFANQNVVCRLHDESTVDYLKREFGINNV